MEEIEITKPKELTYKTVVYWSTSLRKLEGIKEGNAIKTKALKLIQLNLVSYDSDSKTFKVNPIKGYNKTTYEVNNRGDGHFECSCQFYNQVSKNWEHPICSHIQAVKLWLEIKRWNGGKNEREQ